MLTFNTNKSRYYIFEYNIMSMELEFDETFIIRYGK